MTANTIDIDKLKLETTPKEFARKLLWNIANQYEAVQGAFYYKTTNADKVTVFRFIEGYAYHIAETSTLEFELGDGLIGQVAIDGKAMMLNDVPEGYLNVLSGLGHSSPTNLLIFPFVKENEITAIMELAFFKAPGNELQTQVAQLTDLVCGKINAFKQNAALL